MTRHRVVFDFEIAFSNGGGLKGRDFRLDLDGEDIDDAALAEYIVRDLRLLMAGEVRIANKRVPEEPHERPRIEAIDYDDAVAALLRAAGLPTADLDAAAAPVRLFGRRRNGVPMAAVGVERHGEAALLRSLAVAEALRGRGLARELVAHAERRAADAGVRRLFLLTTHAAGYFARLGYAPTPREAAPAAIAATAQFAQLCPASWAFMAKALR
ncbi:arsenic resistance N-acetyltransferase ArsN2 [Vulcaniibacterium tengchongense]|uniref:Acetyltransferase (GNAT) family protein n=1 Tax=Vulcaniibacterium tengchongense TaxID=1273429 RepID=A0A3N4VJJ3_9GAMM|nr:arsenic resistance N-acetyltransferase ArsN2 [Vulcaniibacterium tengchongense]RPE77207.1 acetyltransferase (GNAT) family protein [Vulcaniibacterium tengchongense]